MRIEDFNVKFDEQSGDWDLTVKNHSGVGPAWLHVDYFDSEESALSFAKEKCED